MNYNADRIGIELNKNNANISKQAKSTSDETRNKSLNKLDYEQQYHLLNDFKITRKQQSSADSVNVPDMNNSCSGYNNNTDPLSSTATNSFGNKISAHTEERLSRRPSNNKSLAQFSDQTQENKRASEKRNRSASILKRFNFNFRMNSAERDTHCDNNSNSSKATRNHKQEKIYTSTQTVWVAQKTSNNMQDEASRDKESLITSSNANNASNSLSNESKCN